MKRTLLLILMIVIVTQLVSAYRCPLHVTEGELLSLESQGYDPDMDSLEWIYPEPLDTRGNWQTSVGDAGVYHFSIGLSDGEFADWFNTCLEVFPLKGIEIKPKEHYVRNRPPLIDGVKDIEMGVGDKLNLKFACSDPDGDAVQIYYNGWPGKMSHTATTADLGTHLSSVRCMDSKGSETIKTMFIKVKSRTAGPIITSGEIIVSEGQVVDLRDHVTDLDTSKSALRYSATGIFAYSVAWKTRIGDAGVYPTKLSVSDGEHLVSRMIYVKVIPAPKRSFMIAPSAVIEPPVKKPGCITDVITYEYFVTDDMDVVFTEPKEDTFCSTEANGIPCNNYII